MTTDVNNDVARLIIEATESIQSAKNLIKDPNKKEVEQILTTRHVQFVRNGQHEKSNTLVEISRILNLKITL